VFVRLSNTPRDYSWGSTTAIPELLGTPSTGGPQAELWLGAHPGSPAEIVDPSTADGASDLGEWIASDREAVLGGREQLPFLLKILAAAGPLSLQAHPTLARAAEGFALENAAGIPLDAPNRNYKDALHKPEVIFALSETFDALCGFRPLEEIRAISGLLTEWDAASASPTPAVLASFASRVAGSDEHVVLRELVAWLLPGGEEVAALVARVSELAADAVGRAVGSAGAAGAAGAGDAGAAGAVGEGNAGAAGAAGEGDAGAAGAGIDAAGAGSVPFAASFGTVVDLAREYPGDPGIVTSLLLNRVTLRAGEALYLPAGNIHAYLRGLGVELMAASDNVLRGGLTPKHIDVPELLEVLQFESVPVPYLRPTHPSPGVEEFRPDVPDFVLVRVKTELNERAAYRPEGPAIAICTAGGFELHGESSGTTIERGEAVFITPDEGAVTFTGEGTLFLAAPGAPA
jgi:mannose-6-phosphate isomerase